jgi:hypothetical protein
MNRTKLKLLIGDFFILLVFALGPGIRGYSEWHFWEYLMIAVIAGYILYLRHKKSRQTDIE